MPYYVKVTKQVRDAILPANISVTRTFDGNYLMFQSALSGVTGATLSDRVAKVGGSLLTVLEAKQEVSGEICKECYTPEEYAGKTEVEAGDTEAAADGEPESESDDQKQQPTGIQPTSVGTQEVNIPSVVAPGTDGEPGSESGNESDNAKEESEVEDEQ